MPFSPDSRLECRDLACVRGDNLLFENFSLDVGAGEVCQVHGANGAGKTSLMRIICGLATPERGEVRWCGEPIDHHVESFRSRLSYVGHLNGVKAELSPIENLDAARSISPTRRDVTTTTALDRAGLAGYEDIPCRFLSAGQKRRVAIARLLMSGAQLWVLDEPATALDADGVTDFQRLLETHAANGGMVVITSHQPLHFEGVHARAVHL